MSDAKPFASLGATLLARKGGAKPAMRPQSSRVVAASQVAAQNLEDLGWDDMGEEHPVADHSAEVLHLTPAPHNEEAEALTDVASPKPKVLSMHEELAVRIEEEERKKAPKTQALPPIEEREQRSDDEEGAESAFAPAAPVTLRAALPVAAPKVEARPEPRPEPVVREAPRRKPTAANDMAKRAAFTLRLDARRHLKLRLASTVRGRSAQQIVTDALDRYLKEIPEIEALAAQLKRD